MVLPGLPLIRWLLIGPTWDVDLSICLFWLQCRRSRLMSSLLLSTHRDIVKYLNPSYSLLTRHAQPAAKPPQLYKEPQYHLHSRDVRLVHM
jgi:hypothetical protein